MIDNLWVVVHIYAYVEITFSRWDIATDVCELVY